MEILYSYWNKLIEPHPHIVDADNRRSARFFSVLMLFLLGLTSAYLVFAEIITTQVQGMPSPLLSNLTAVVVMLSGYLLSRSRFANLAAIVFIIIFTAFLYLVMAFELQRDESAIGMIFYSMFSVLIAGIIFSNRGLLLVSFGNLIVMFLYAAFGPGMTAHYALGYVINSSLLVVATTAFLAYRIQIDERRKQELALNEKQWRDLIELAPMAIAVHVDGKFVYMNPMGLRLFGTASLEDILDKPIVDYIHPDYRKIVQERIQKQQKGERTTPMKQKFIRLNGEIFDVEVTGISITYQGEPMIQTIFRDITESKQAEDALRESEQKHKALINNIPGMVYMGFPDWSAEIIRGGEEICEYTNHEINAKARGWLDIIHPDYQAQIQEEAIEIQKRPASIAQIYQIITKTGDTRWVEDHKTSIFDETGAFKLLHGIVFDITERKKAEKEHLDLAFERERRQILASFITHASHEFRTPLSLINTCTYLLGKDINPDKNKKQIHTINEQVKSITKLIEAMTTMTKLDGIRKLEREETDVCAIVTNINASKQAIFQESKLQSVLKLETQDLFIQANSDYLQQALDAIVDNAIRFTPEGGMITIFVDSRQGAAIIEISDTGIGINADDLPHIFERFYRWDKVGTTRGFGLGLPIAKSIIELHQGHIEVKSEVGKGSTFTIWLPMEFQIKS